MQNRYVAGPGHPSRSYGRLEAVCGGGLAKFGVIRSNPLVLAAGLVFGSKTPGEKAPPLAKKSLLQNRYVAGPGHPSRLYERLEAVCGGGLAKFGVIWSNPLVLAAVLVFGWLGKRSECQFSRRF